MAGYTEPRLHQAEVLLKATLDNYTWDQFFYNRLEMLLDTPLNRCSMESYEECLFRGLNTAGDMFSGIDFTHNPYIRNQTADWITNNCGRLIHTPQLSTPERYVASSGDWERVSDKYRQYAVEAFSLIKDKTALLWVWWSGENSQLDAVPIVLESTNTTRQLQRSLEMPFGFSLDCEEPPPCRLVYTGQFYSSADETLTSEEAIDRARKEVKKWSWSFDRVLDINSYMLILMAFLQSLLLNFFLLETIVPRLHSRPAPSRPTPSLSTTIAGTWSHIWNVTIHLQGDEQLVLGLIIHVTLYSLLHTQLGYLTAEFDRPLLPVGAGFCVFHFLHILAFMDITLGKTESLGSGCRALRELHLIAQGHELPQLIPKKRSCSSREDKDTSSKAQPASKITTRFISPVTSISEDILHERKAMYAERGIHPRTNSEVEVGSVVEADSDYDSDVQHASYVDLTGGADPMVSEEGSDWCVVED